MVTQKLRSLHSRNHGHFVGLEEDPDTSWLRFTPRERWITQNYRIGPDLGP